MDSDIGPELVSWMTASTLTLTLTLIATGLNIVIGGTRRTSFVRRAKSEWSGPVRELKREESTIGYRDTSIVEMVSRIGERLSEVQVSSMCDSVILLAAAPLTMCRGARSPEV